MKATLILRPMYTQVFRCGLVVMMLAVYAHGQSRDQKVFSAIPEPLRPPLIEKLNLYIKYQQTRQYDKLYDLLSDSAIAKVYHSQSKVDFVKAYQRGDAECRSSKLVEFKPTDTDKIEGDNTDVYLIYGDAKFSEEGKLIEKRIIIESQLQNGYWYFGPIGEVVVD